VSQGLRAVIEAPRGEGAPPPRPASPPALGSMLDAPPAPRTGTPWLASAGAVMIHAALVLLATVVGTGIARTSAPARSETIEVELPPPPAPPPDPDPDPDPEPQPRPRPRAAPREAPPPAAAQAGRVVEAPDEVLDFGDTVVASQAAVHAGGVTESGGTSAQAVRDGNARASGVEGGTGTSPGGDLSQLPRLAGGMEWDCPFPIEADTAGVDRAVVNLRVEVGAEGRVKAVEATSDPGHGFAREARACALRKRWSPAVDRAGRVVAAAVLVKVRFER
jgi:periplasmic protein TonB